MKHNRALQLTPKAALCLLMESTELNRYVFFGCGKNTNVDDINIKYIIFFQGLVFIVSCLLDAPIKDK